MNKICKHKNNYQNCKECHMSTPTKPWEEKEKKLHKRFLERIKELPNGCWEWQGVKNVQGYGQFHFDNKTNIAHRYAYRVYIGEIPTGLTIDHQCNYTSCVNPEHLKAMTMRENVLRSNAVSAIHARKTHCIRGHEFNKENTHYGSRRRGRTEGHIFRCCILCRRMLHRKYKAKLRQLKK